MAQRGMITAETRYLAKIDMSGGSNACHPWTSTVNKKGYGRFWDGTYLPSGAPKLVAAHKWGYIHFIGDPGTPVFRHTCDNPPCQNLTHLIPGTHAENMADMVARGRSRAPSFPGSTNPHSVLTEDLVRAIRQRHVEGARVIDIARETGLRHQLISQVVRRVTWGHVD